MVEQEDPVRLLEVVEQVEVVELLEVVVLVTIVVTALRAELVWQVCEQGQPGLGGRCVGWFPPRYPGMLCDLVGLVVVQISTLAYDLLFRADGMSLAPQLSSVTGWPGCRKEM